MFFKTSDLEINEIKEIKEGRPGLNPVVGPFVFNDSRLAR